MKKVSKKSKKRKKSRFRIFKITMLVVFFMLLLSSLVFAGAAIAMVKNSPELNVNRILNLNQPSALFDDKKQKMDDVITNEKRILVPLKDIPNNLKNAFISIEDERFYDHGGIDVKRILGAALINFKHKITGKRGLQGASTITQQLIKNTLLSSEVTVKRKVQEIYMAIQLEKILNKNQILESYLNTIYLGGRAHGVEAASEQYFSKPSKDLSLPQCAFIAGLTQSPSFYYPFSNNCKKNKSIYLNRTKTVLAKMYQNNYITQKEYNSAIQEINSKGLQFKPNISTSFKMNYEWFSREVIKQVKNDLQKKYHYTEAQVNSQIMYGGLKIYTTMDRDMQNNTQSILNDDSSFGINSKYKNGIMEPQASAVIIDYHTGEVKALVGGRGKQPPMSYNRASSFYRPAGSSIKPLTVYAPAIDTKKDTSASIIEDAPLPADIGRLYSSDPNKPYNPKNSNNSYYGNITLADALMHSVNIVAVKLEHQLGLKTGIEYAEKFGLKLDNDDKSSISALSLGQLHYGTNTLTMAAAYGVFGDNGVYIKPRMYTRVEDKTGKVLLENNPCSRRVLSPQAAYIMYDLLKGPVSPEGTGSAAVFGDMPVRGKTGTSTASKDLWFCGLTPYYSAAVWIGTDNNSNFSESLQYGKYIGSSDAARIWGLIMKSAHRDLQPKDIPQPPNIVAASICRDSGKLATKACFKCNRATTSYFIEGTEPSEYDDTHVEKRINKITGNEASDLTPDFLTKKKVINKNDSTENEQDIKNTKGKKSKKHKSHNSNDTLGKIKNMFEN